jgi:hypothetical protein
MVSGERKQSDISLGSTIGDPNPVSGRIKNKQGDLK